MSKLALTNNLFKKKKKNEKLGEEKGEHTEEDKEEGGSEEVDCNDPATKIRHSRLGFIPRPRRGGYLPLTPEEQQMALGLNSAHARRVIFHKRNDLSLPAIDRDEATKTTYTPTDHIYSAWDKCVQPLRQLNIATGLAGAVSLVARIASQGGTEGITHEDCWETVQFLKTIEDDRGELPPNILGLLEYIDYKTREDGTSIATTHSIFI